MIRRPPRSTRTDTLFPYTTLFRSVLLLDEPCSALDPISTAKIEELIAEIKSEYTVVIVTHNMQQAARCSEYTAYMYLGELMEFGETDQIFVKQARKETEDYRSEEHRVGKECVSK